MRCAKRYWRILLSANQPMAAIRTLKRAVRKLALSGYLTPIHADFLQACLLSKNYKGIVLLFDGRVCSYSAEN